MLRHITRVLLCLFPVIILLGGSHSRYTPRRSPGVAVNTHTLKLADEKIWVHVYERPGSEIVFVNLHDNENTSMEAALPLLTAP